MNIFYLDSDPTTAAQYHNDRHNNKMILETAQLLCSVYHVCDDGDNDIPYKLTHRNHPCAVWARHSRENFDWLCRLGLALCKEFTHRRGKTHACEAKIKWCVDNARTLDFPATGFTEPPLAMPQAHKIGNAVDSYRRYYIIEKRADKNGKRMDIWTNRERPHWYVG